jgi:hypothetical protein
MRVAEIIMAGASHKNYNTTCNPHFDTLKLEKNLSFNPLVTKISGRKRFSSKSLSSHKIWRRIENKTIDCGNSYLRTKDRNLHIKM